MENFSPRVGRRVRFEGRHKHLEGSVLHVELPARQSAPHQVVILLLEVTKHLATAPAFDGAHRIMSVVVPLDGENNVDVLPAEEPKQP